MQLRSRWKRATRTRLGLLARTTFVLSSLVAACNLGDDYFSPGFGGSGGVGGFFDAGTNQQPPGECAAAEERGFCTGEVDLCETGKSANFACNERLRCTSQSWRANDEEAPPGCDLPCPAAFVRDLPDGCAMPNAGSLQCEYPEGTCGCAPVHPVDSDAGDAGDAGDSLDGGAEEDADAAPKNYLWTCVQPEAGCPRTRPRAGTECVRPLSCDYGQCVFRYGRRMECYSGHWTTVGGSSLCP